MSLRLSASMGAAVIIFVRMMVFSCIHVFSHVEDDLLALLKRLKAPL